MDRTIRLGYSHGSGVISGIFYRLLPVQILLMVLSSINTIIDGLFASNCISLVAMDATGLFAPVNGVISAIGAVMLGGSQILCGNFMGKNQDEATNGVFSLDMVVITVLGAILTLTCLFFSSPLALLLGAKGAVADELALYIWGISFGFVPMMISSTQLSAFLQMENEQKRTYIGIAAMMVSNTLFDWLFIVRMDLGMLGLGLASSLSNLVFVFVLLSRYFSGKTSMHFSLKLIAWKVSGGGGPLQDVLALEPLRGSGRLFGQLAQRRKRGHALLDGLARAKGLRVLPQRAPALLFGVRLSEFPVFERGLFLCRRRRLRHPQHGHGPPSEK